MDILDFNGIGFKIIPSEHMNLRQNLYRSDILTYKEKIKYIIDNYLQFSANELSKIVGFHPNSIRRIAKAYNITKRIDCVPFPNEKFISLSQLGFSLYEISNFGRFRRIDNNILICHSYTIDGYWTIKLVDDSGKRRINRVHRLVASVFLPPNDDPVNKRG